MSGSGMSKAREKPLFISKKIPRRFAPREKVKVYKGD
jgi:hypothetical protein